MLHGILRLTEFRLIKDPSKNNFDLLRLLFALFVIFSHSYALLVLPEPLSHLTGGVLSQHGVNGFFFISGLLIAQSWMRGPYLFRFAWKRFLRIFPGLAASVLFAILVIGPLTTTLPLLDYLLNPRTVEYLKHNLALYKVRFYLPGVFEDNPFKFAVNGSIWTMPYEVLMYGVVALLGVLGALKGPHWALVMVVVLLAVEAFAAGEPAFKEVVFCDILLNQLVTLGTFFLLGVVSAFFLGRIRVSVLAVFLIPLLITWYPVSKITWYFLFSYWTLCAAYALPAYLHKTASKIDISYGMYIYAFPIQQTLIHFAYPILSPIGLFLVSTFCTLPVAMLSWIFLERPALSLKALTTKEPRRLFPSFGQS